METTASIIAVIQLCEKVIKYIIAVSGEKAEKLQDEAEESEEADEWSRGLELLSTPLLRLHEALSLAAAALSPSGGISEKLRWPFKEKDVGKLIDAIDSEMAMVSLAIDGNTTRLLHSINARTKNNENLLIELRQTLNVRVGKAHQELQEIGNKVYSVQTSQEVVLNRVEDLHVRQTLEEAQKTRQLILNWLPSTSHDSQQRDAISRRQPGTGTWLLQSQKYRDWLDTEGATLFCPGIPGAGKTILASIINADLWERYHHDSEVGLTYLFCNFKRRDEQTLDSLLFALLAQLVEQQPELPKQVEDFYKEQQKTSSNRTTVIAQTLELLAAGYKRIFVVLDALDECSTDDSCRTKLLSHIAKLSKLAKTPGTESEKAVYHVNLLVTARPLRDIEWVYKDCPMLNIEANDADVRTYLVENMSRLPGFVQKSTQLQEEIATRIIDSVQGMFLLAKLHLDSIVGKRSVKAVRTVLGKLATGSEAYKSVYEDAMERIEGQVTDMAELAKQTLALITCVRRPLSTSELQQALAVEINEPDLDPDNFPDIDDVVSACAGLVTINEENKIIGLVHYTTQEYLEQNQQRWFPDAQAMITEVCTTYLAFEPFSKSESIRGTAISEYTFHGYAAIEWGHHARLAPDAHSQVMNFLERPLSVVASHKRSQPSYRKLIYVHAMHVASEFGLEAPLAKFLEQDLDPDHLALYYDTRKWQKSNESITPLLVAARYGHENIVKMLLEHGADANYTSEHRNNASIYAKHNKQNSVIDRLIKHGANSEQQTALHEAAERGDLARTEELIRSKNARINALNGRRETPLIIAARSGHCEVADCLLKAGANLEICDYHGHSALLAATRFSHYEIVELLLTTGADPHAVGDAIPTDVSHKSNETPYEASIRGLLHEKFESDKKYRNGVSALMLAADLDDLDSAVLLLKAGTQVWRTDIGGRTALGYAVMSESVLVAKAILEVYTEPMRATEFHSLLGAASARGDSDMVALLLDFGARVQQYDPHEISDEISPLTRAAQSWCKFDMSKPHDVIMARRFEVTARSLLGAGVGPECETFIDTESHAIELLLLAGVDINSSDEDGYTPLIWACLYGDLSLVKLYLKLGANPNVTKGQSRTPLYEACHARKPEEDKIKELLDHGADVNQQDKYGRTALFAVRLAAPGSASLISLLIKAGANVHHRSHKGRTPMFLAAKKHAVEVVQLYLRYGASAVARDRAGMTPLSLAVQAPAPAEPDSGGRYAATVRLLNTHIRSVSISNLRRSLALPTVLARSPSTGRPRAGDRGLPIVVD
ncbi:unnamed protein product [Alternaria sp. RS040]